MNCIMSLNCLHLQLCIAACYENAGTGHSPQQEPNKTASLLLRLSCYSASIYDRKSYIIRNWCSRRHGLHVHHKACISKKTGGRLRFNLIQPTTESFKMNDIFWHKKSLFTKIRLSYRRAWALSRPRAASAWPAFKESDFS